MQVLPRDSPGGGRLPTRRQCKVEGLPRAPYFFLGFETGVEMPLPINSGDFEWLPSWDQKPSHISKSAGKFTTDSFHLFTGILSDLHPRPGKIAAGQSFPGRMFSTLRFLLATETGIVFAIASMPREPTRARGPDITLRRCRHSGVLSDEVKFSGRFPPKTVNFGAGVKFDYAHLTDWSSATPGLPETKPEIGLSRVFAGVL